MKTFLLFILSCSVAHSYFETEHKQDFGFCNRGPVQTFLLGDFNADGLDDALCHTGNWDDREQFNEEDMNGQIEISYGLEPYGFKDTGDSVDWSFSMLFCYADGDSVYLADDLDGWEGTDMVCHNSITGKIHTALADTENGTFLNFWENELVFCHADGDQLLLGDINGDGRTDLLCHNQNTGSKAAALANLDGMFVKIYWEMDVKSCKGDGARLLMGDFNGDGRSDMLCHETSDDHFWVALADIYGTFPGTNWEKTMEWCNGDGQVIFIGDFNGDSRDDMLCHFYTNGYKVVALASADGSFTGTSWEKSLRWCYHTGAVLSVGNFDGDSTADLLCRDGTWLWLRF